jgi:hypothetical protein
MTTAQRRSPSRAQPLAGLSASRLARALARVSARHDFAAPATFPWQTGRSAGPEQSLRAIALSRDRFYAIREVWALSDITRSSWVREVISSLVNTLRRW